ncbi:ABC transporter ATP-binding protein/permease [Streptococcus gallolyticus]|uniref:ABC transporter ATP-binding protein n=1 Tax=Streptococcus hepaticus TaxID=3349163 RepID=UPI001C95209E|nr:ABC transporter ATP-binding protein/permease [Streptococcus gallolyticus]MBY5040076.1 ABC transporter ATP-binding protein/permease [Streptococcus gallolyticus]
MFQLIFNYIKQHKWLYLLIAALLIVYDMTMLVPTKVIQGLVDKLSSQALTAETLWTNVGILVAATLINYLSAYIWHYKLFQGSVNFKFDMQWQAFRKLVSMRTPFYEKFRSGDMMTRFSTDVEGLMEMVGYGLMIVVYAGGMIAFIIPTMFLISWQITLLAMLPMLVLMTGSYLISRKQDDLIEERRIAIAEVNNEVLEAVEGIRVTRAYSKKSVQGTRFAKRTRELSHMGDKITALQSIYHPMGSLLIGLSTTLVLFMGAHCLRLGQVSLGQVIALQLYMVSLIEPFWMLSDFVLVYQTGKTSFSKVNELITTGDDMEADGEKWLAKGQDFVLENYDFAYPNADRLSLCGINWRLKAGQTVGIVGKTGSGKTTLVRQFLRQYPLGQGTFAVDGQPITAYKRRSVEDLIGYVPQEHILFSKSVRENIALGKEDASQKEIEQAVRTAAFEGDLERMSSGLDTMIGERGVSISGGQKQRISIARAFLRDPDLLILDDSLSAVDARTERQIIQNIQKERAGKTNIIVTHRLSAVNHADWVLVLDDGAIVEEGPPADLLEMGGWYYEQYQRQQTEEKGEESCA